MKDLWLHHWQNLVKQRQINHRQQLMRPGLKLNHQLFKIRRSINQRFLQHRQQNHCMFMQFIWLHLINFQLKEIIVLIKLINQQVLKQQPMLHYMQQVFQHRHSLLLKFILQYSLLHFRNHMNH